jgi:hypothetical protein
MALDATLAEQLPRLYAVQEVDERIRRFAEQRRTLERRAKQLDAALRKEQSQLEAKREAHTSLQVDQRRKNVELQALQERLKKYTEQQKNARDANEYVALTKQIETSTHQVDALESEIIELLLKLDEAKAALDAETERFAAAQTEMEQERKRVALTVKRIDAEMEKAKRARQAASGDVDPAFLREYESWRERSGGATMVARLVKETCDGCQMTIPPQMAIEVRRMARRFTCPSCHRLFYPVDDTPPAEPPSEPDTNA